MEDQARTRLDLLRQEFESGQRQLSDLDGRRAQLTETMLRISGAIQVLEELLGERPLEHAPAGNGTELEATERAAAG
jgi:hypothetical protein